MTGPASAIPVAESVISAWATADFQVMAETGCLWRHAGIGPVAGSGKVALND